jgi:hypothetical protein
MDEKNRTVNAEYRLDGAWQPRVGVGVLLVDQYRRVLLTLRKLPPEAGCWSIVGGQTRLPGEAGGLCRAGSV